MTLLVWAIVYTPFTYSYPLKGPIEGTGETDPDSTIVHIRIQDGVASRAGRHVAIDEN